MKVAAVLCLTAVCAAQTVAPGSTTALGNGSISGVVRDVSTGAPVAEAAVSLHMPNGGVVASQADAQGQYTLSGLTPGTYRVNASAPLEKGETQTPRQEKTVKLELGQRVASLDFRLPSMATVAGRVLDENKEPVPGVPVVLVEKRYDHGALTYRLAGGSAQTDEAGVYKLTGIPAGAAFLIETHNPLPVKSTGGDTPADTFFPNVRSAESATEIVLSPGETRNGVDIQQRKLPAYCVDGVVEGAPESGLDIEVLDAVVKRPISSQHDAIGKTKTDGTFHVCGLHSGQYTFSTSNPNQKPFRATGTVTVANDDVHGFQLLYTAAPLPFTAEFAWDVDPPATPPVLVVRLTLLGRQEGVQVSFGLKVPSSFSRPLPIPADDYAIEVQGIDGGGRYLKDITCGGRSVLRDRAPLGGASSCGALRFVLAHDAGSLIANVADKDGNPIPDAYVAIIPESAATEAEMSATMTFGQTGLSGVYLANALPPGKYRVLATNQTVDLASNRVDMLWAAQSRAQEVEIGVNGSVRLKLQPQLLQ